MSGSVTESAPEDLPYRVDLHQEGDFEKIERVLARAANAQLAQAIFKAAVGEYSGRRITLRKNGDLVADSRR